ncbi:MAG: glutamate racemase [Patescibacteria group bacterium]|nr:glutamate racemase [Patescibacteria group bacterium]
MNDRKLQPIGIFDSGIGGLSVLEEARKLLPHEDFIYFSDSANFPYGDKKTNELKKIIIKNIKTLVDAGCKAIVIACNTATSVAITDLRKKFSIPIIGMEPAIKPALEGRHEKILVLATPLTLKLEKFNQLRSKLDKEDELIILPAKGLAGLIEKNVLNGSDKKEIKKYLEKLFSKINKKEISTVVLGCTHYVFIKDLVQKLFSGKKVIDGNLGTVQHLKKVLKEKNLLNKQKGKGNVCQINTK